MLSGEPTAKGTGLDAPAGKEDPVEFDSSLMSCSDMVGVEEVGGQCQGCAGPSSKAKKARGSACAGKPKSSYSMRHEPAMKYHYHHRHFAH